MLEVLNFTCVGEAYVNGRHVPGWGYIHLSDGTKVYVPEKSAYFSKMVEIAKNKGFNTTKIERRINNWVCTGAWIV